MKKKTFKKIETFREFYRGNRKTNEETNIQVEIDWWDEAIDRIMNQLHYTAGNPLVWENLWDYCRAKWMVLGREIPIIVDELILEHLRELIFQNYGETLLHGEDLSSCSSQKNASLGTKILVVAQLSDTILQKIKVEAGILSNPEKSEESPKTVASVSLDDGVYDEDDIPFEGNRYMVYGLDDYTKAVNETFYHLQCDQFNAVLDKCLRDLESAQKGGVIDYDKVLKSAKKEVKGKDEKDCIDKYLTSLVRKHMKDVKITIDGVDVRDIPRTKVNILKSVKNLFIYHIVKEIYGRMNNEKVK